ncbi:tyrosine-protein kinase STYK1 isoform X1 [Labrus bergylta]|uniref:tyrosine-protein kinase STYK1 isoform X1 n=1 Tax=Labrus bergylta TaxID=56723 RepID=UPI00331373F6
MSAAPHGCSNNTYHSMCTEEASGPLAVIIIPCLLTLSTVLVVVLIFCSLHKSKQRRQSNLVNFTNGQQSVSLTASSVSTPKVQAALSPWEIPEECVLEGLEFWQTGRLGPICKGLLKRSDGASCAVVVKSLQDESNQPEGKELEWVLFHATVCKHENVVQLLYCQTKCLPVCLVLEAYSPGNLLHFLWSLRNRGSNSEDPFLNFSERSVYLVAKQVAAGLDYLMSEHRLVHGDVAARNILIGPGLSARVSGLGVAFEGRRMDPAAFRQRAAEVPLKWQAPERLAMQLSIDRGDVWSFGILLYELLTLGSPPYPELDPLSVLPKLQGSYRMKRPVSCGGPLYDLMKYCWMWCFKDRPPFSAVIKLLDSSLHLAATKDICVFEVIDIPEYNRKAGLPNTTKTD